MNTQRQGSNTLEGIPTEQIEDEVDINKKVSIYIKNQLQAVRVIKFNWCYLNFYNLH